MLCQLNYDLAIVVLNFGIGIRFPGATQSLFDYLFGYYAMWYFYSAHFLTSIVETRFHDISLNSYTKELMSYKNCFEYCKLLELFPLVFLCT